MKDYPNNHKYKIIQKLGQGGFGTVYKVLNKDNNNIYVIKKILKLNNKEEKKEIKNETNILASINNEYIVKYYESFSDDDSFNIVMEYCEGLDLRRFIDEHKKKNKFLEKELIYQIISDICLGIKEIHNKNLIHRDLKPDNLFIGSDFKIKIGDFGISKQLDIYNDYAKTPVGTLRYTAPEIIKGQKYNNKVDIWSLGCIIYELCTLNLCFDSDNMITLISKIIESKHGEINENIYGRNLQILIDLLLEKDSQKRLNIDNIITIIKKDINKLKFEKKIELFLQNEIYEEYTIEKEIKKSLDQIDTKIIQKEDKYKDIKEWLLSAGLFIGTFPITLILSIGAAFSTKIFFLRNEFFDFCCELSHFPIINDEKKLNFINDNRILIQFIKSKLLKIIKEKLDEKLLFEKIIIYNQYNFEKILIKIQNYLISRKDIGIIKKNFNILLLGGTNVGKSTLINEFLKLEKEKKAKEGDGGETLTIDFTPYIGKRNKLQYTLYDTNGITLEGENSIENKKINTLKEIKERINKQNPNELIHCIWYCLTGSIVQKADGTFINDLLQVYMTYKIPIIFVHTKSFSNTDTKVCKDGLKKILLKICKGDESQVKEHLKNYIKVIAREDEDDDDDDENEENKEGQKTKAFGLDKLEKISREEILEKGKKSSYYEFIRRNILDILINIAFNKVFHNEHVKNLINIITNDIKQYLITIENILNSEKLQLTDEIKNNNKISLNKIYNSFKNAKQSLINEFNNFLSKDYLKRDNEKFVKEIYENKSDNYKKEMNFNDYCQNIEKLIYNNMVKNSKEIINNLMNISFNSYISQIMKNTIREQFQQKEEEYIKAIYSKLSEKI